MWFIKSCFLDLIYKKEFAVLKIKRHMCRKRHGVSSYGVWLRARQGTLDAVGSSTGERLDDGQ